MEDDDEDQDGNVSGRGGIDWDMRFAYDTYKVVRIKDGSLGLMYWSIISFTVMYIMIKVFYIDRLHQESDPGLGTVLVRFSGKAHLAGDTSKVFDAADLRHPVIEPAGAFIMTRRFVMKDQKFGSCVDWDNPMPCPCTDGGVCNGEHCETQGWCPSLGYANVDDPPQGAEVQDIEGLEATVFTINAGIAFPFAGNYFYTSDTGDPKPNLKNITLGQLLKQANPPLTVSELSKKGALIGVNLLWSCELTSVRTMLGDLGDVPTGLGEEAQPCPYHLTVSRLDGGEGFVQRRARRRRVKGEDVRDAIYTAGLRVVVHSSGVGQRVSLVLIAIQMGSMFSLLKVASMLTDKVMLTCYSKDKREAYEKCKIEKTQDFSDLKDRIDQVEDQRKRFRDDRRAGHTSTSLGLGLGGRGGSGAAILRGR